MSHVVLLGDSIFDNARYVPGRPPVIEQVRRGLPGGWRATLVATDGHTVEDIPLQLPRVPDSATHLVVSIGGNDALGAAGVMTEPAESVADGLAALGAVVAAFHDEYAGALRTLQGLGKPLVVCTVYDAIPTLSAAERVGLGGFNDAILRAAVAAGVPVIDLRLVCPHPGDYSPLSPIEPSVAGGAKIADAVVRAVTTHDFSARRTTVYV